MRAVIDTCIIIDALQSRRPFCQDAEAVILAAANKQFIGFLTAKSITDIYYLTHHYTHNDSASRDVLRKLFHLFDLLDTTGMDCRRALSSDMSDYEDAVMAESSVRTGADCIVTRNQKDYDKAPLPVYTPAEFLALLRPGAEELPETEELTE